MYVQKIRTKDNKIRYILLDDNDEIVVCVMDYLKYLDSRRLALNTLKNYAYHLKLYFEYLEEIEKSYDSITDDNQELNVLAGFVSYLNKLDEKVIYTQYSERPERRTASTVNTILSAVLSFYEYLFRTGSIDRELNVYREGVLSSYKGVLYEMGTGKKKYITSVLKLKEKDRSIKTVSREEVELLIKNCHYIRDKFLISLLFESGLRLGEALGLRKSDFVIWDNKVKVVARSNEENGASVKNKAEGEIIIPTSVVQLYFEYLNNEFIDNEESYIFVNLKGANKGKPMKAITVEKLFYRLSKECNIKVTPHILRHSHATELIEVGNWDAVYVKERLRHRQIQTTINTYVHLSDKYKKEKFKEFQDKLGDDNEEE
ncbi:MAG TPA: transposase [Clostridium sp.]|nr:transposase [Clostridium sp.]